MIHSTRNSHLLLPINDHVNFFAVFVPVTILPGSCKLFTTQDIRGKDKSYSDLKHSYQISLLANAAMCEDELVNEIIKVEEGIAMGAQALLNISKDERERARLTSEYKFAVDLQSKTVDARRDGIKDGIRQVARNLLGAGDSVEKIITVTGLSREEVEGL